MHNIILQLCYNYNKRRLKVQSAASKHLERVGVSIDRQTGQYCYCIVE